LLGADGDVTCVVVFSVIASDFCNYKYFAYHFVESSE
jgi:hypothetical protein